ncbi:MAG: hypothetical protein AAF357_20055, partial [Verrucomicrobiota bacterium]
IASAALAWINKGTLDTTIADRQRKEQQVEQVTQQLEKTNAEIEETTTKTRETEEETESLQTQLASLQVQVSDAEVQIQDLNSDIQDADEEIKNLEEVRRVFRNIEMIDQKIAGLKGEVQMLETQIVSVENLLAVEKAKKMDKDKTISTYEAMNRFRNKGQMWLDISSTVKAAYNDWGFVIINAGDDDGLAPAATLDVTRDGKAICKLLVTEIEPGQAVADIIEATLLPGQTVQIGDTVSKKATVSLP